MERLQSFQQTYCCIAEYCKGKTTRGEGRTRTWKHSGFTLIKDVWLTEYWNRFTCGGNMKDTFALEKTCFLSQNDLKHVFQKCYCESRLWHWDPGRNWKGSLLTSWSVLSIISRSLHKDILTVHSGVLLYSNVSTGFQFGCIISASTVRWILHTHTTLYTFTKWNLSRGRPLLAVSSAASPLISLIGLSRFLLATMPLHLRLR